MIGAIIKYGNNSLTTELPVEALRLHNQLGSIGITDRADKIPALGNADIHCVIAAYQKGCRSVAHQPINRRRLSA